MKLNHLFRIKRQFSFKKIHLNGHTHGSTFAEQLYNYTWSTITDGAIMREMKKLAKECNVEIDAMREHPWKSDAYVVTVIAYKDDFVNFVTEFMTRFQKYVEEVEF